MKLYITLLVLLMSSSPAYAYLDPGSGSAIISAIVGFFVALSMVIKTYWYKLKSLFKKGAGQMEQDEGSASESQIEDSEK